MVDVRIADPNDNDNVDPLPVGEHGEVLLRSPYTMDGYHDRPDGIAETLVDGWLRTGDIGKRDDAGYVYLLDRENDEIVSGGMPDRPTESVTSGPIVPCPSRIPPPDEITEVQRVDIVACDVTGADRPGHRCGA
jgi:hypothetical protein